MYSSLVNLLLTSSGAYHLIQSISSKITLIHDVWKTKGNQQAFLGISATYISDNWTFRVCHLALKYIAWNHKGKYLAIPFCNVMTKSSLVDKISPTFDLSFSFPKANPPLDKYILAQTTDSGSNNGTMTAEVDSIICQKTGTNLNLTDNHIQ